MYLRIKSNILKIMNTKPTYNKLPYIKEIIIEAHTVKHVIQENNFKKNCILKDFVKDLLTNKYSM
jgi:hypothetical protein